MKQRRLAAEWSGPKVMVLHEHHGTWYMDASTEEAFHRSALRVLKGRLEMTDMYYMLDEDEEFRKEGERIVARKDGKAAWEHLRDRFDCEDERISLETINAKYNSDEEE
jgi:hypothetical protein